MTEIIALGTGSAFTMKNYQTNFLVKRNGKYLLIDCGGDVRFSLAKQGLSFKDIDAVWVSHLHQDHVGGLEYLGFTRYFTKKGMEEGGAPNPLPLPKLYTERGLMKDLWEKTLRGGMEGLEGVECTLETYFDVFPIEKNGSLQWEGLTFDMVQSLHISAKYSILDSFGVMFTDIDSEPDNYSEPTRRIFIPTDVQFAPETAMKAYYEECDVIIHDCETMHKSGVHAHYDDLKTLKPEVKAKMRLVHYQDNVSDDPEPDGFKYWDMIPPEVQEEIIAQYKADNVSFETWNAKAIADGFYGFMKPGVIYSSGE